MYVRSQRALIQDIDIGYLRCLISFPPFHDRTHFPSPGSRRSYRPGRGHRVRAASDAAAVGSARQQQPVVPSRPDITEQKEMAVLFDMVLPSEVCKERDQGTKSDQGKEGERRRGGGSSFGRALSESDPNQQYSVHTSHGQLL